MKKAKAMGWLLGLCLAAAQGASAALPAAPAGWGDCEVLDYVAEGGGPAVRGAADAGGTVERWLVRNAAAGTRYALERRPRGGRDMSVCAYSPNRVLATLRPGSSYAAFAAELAAKGMRIVRLLMEDLDGNPVYLIEAEDAETDVVGQMTMGIEETGMCGRISPDRIYEAGAVPNDTDYGRQWGLAKIGAERAWETRTDASGTVLAVLDTGVNFDHYDLNRNLWTNPGEVPGDGVDNDGNGIVDDVYGVACLGGNLSGNPMDDHGHGSHCAGIAGAAGNNRRGGTGVAWTARIMGLKFLNADGRGATSDAITCLRYAEDHGVRVVNCSFGSSDWDDYLYEQMKKMAAKGVLFACAAGNARNGEKPRDNDEYPFYPANFPVENLVAVAASGEDDRLAGFSHYGAKNVDLAAPGVDIYSTTLGTYGMDHKSGTSMATPFVAGALALLWSEWPEETAGRIADRLYAAAEPVAALEGKVRTGARLSMEGFFGLPAPKEVSATQGTVADAVVLYWTAVPGATHYRAWRADSEDGEKTPLGGWRQGLTWSDTEPGPGETKWYFLQAAQSADGAKASSFSAGVPGFRPVPDETKVTVSFDAAGGMAERERQLYTIGEAYGSFPGAEWAGKVFLGWHTAAEGGTRVDETSVADAATTALHAHWIDGDALRVERLSARQRYPWNGLVDVTFELAGVPAGEFASVALEGEWTADGVEGGEAAVSPLATWGAGEPSGLGNGEHHGVWNADADAGAGAFGELALRASASVDVPPPPAEGTAEDNPAEGVIDLSWSVAKGATSYAVSRAENDDRAAAAPAAEVEGASWRDTTAEAGNVYHYWIQSASSGGTSEGALHVWARRGLVPVSLEIGGPDEVDAGTTLQYTATAALNDGSSVDAGNAAAWSIVSGGGLVAFVGQGTLVASQTASGGTAVMRAVFTTNGVSASAEKTVTVRPVALRVAFDGNGGTADPEERTYTAYGTYGELASASRTGYAFGGWFTEAEGGTRVTETDTVPATGTTLYAHWTANAYTVKFNANGGTGTMADQTMTYDVAAMLRANAFTLADSTFMGWTPSAVGDVVWPDCAVVTNLASSQGAIVQLYAVWLAPPTAVSASDASSTEAVTVTWTAASHAKNYEVWRGTGTTPAGATKMAAGVTGTEWADKTAVVGTVYRYWVRSVADGVVSGFAGGDEGRRLVGTPDWFSVEVGDNMTDVHLKWYSYVTGGITYEIWRARYTQVPGGTDTLVGNWTCVASFDSNTRSWDDRPDMTGNAFYQYRVRVLSATDAGGFTKISEVRTYHTPGSYTLHVPASGRYWVSAAGGGGGGAQCLIHTFLGGGFRQAGGGSGGGFQGELELEAGNYDLTVGSGGSGVISDDPYGSPASGYRGEATCLKSNLWTWMFSVGGGGCGIAQGIGDPPHMIAGASGESATGSSIVRSWYNQPGMAGSVGENMVAAGGASVFYGYGAGGGNAAAGGAGVFQITINQ